MTDNYYYVLDGITPLPATKQAWSRQYDPCNSCVNLAAIAEGLLVSTKFTGRNYAYLCPRLAPLVFETVIFADQWVGVIRRYATWKEAEAGHEEECARLRREVG